MAGAGAAGLVAAERAASRGLKTLLLEKNRRPGVKILMSGGTRCNLTHNCDARGIVAAYGTQGRFLHSPLAALGPKDLIALVETEGVPTKVEETGKVFPVSDKATDIVEAFLARLQRSGAELALEEPLTGIEQSAEGFLLTTPLRTLSTARLIVTTGGQSYPGSGTTGDGYEWARRLGHEIVPLQPALTPVTTSAAWVKQLSGVTIPDVALRLLEPAANKPKLLDARRGSFLFTHFGLSGPVALDISRTISRHPRGNTLLLECDFLPDVKEPLLESQLQAAAAAAGKKQLLSLLPELLPRRLYEAVLPQLDVAADTKAGELSKPLRQRVVAAIKRTIIPVAGTRGFGKAEVTAGGVSLAQIDSRDMQSKLIPGLFFAGEVLDLDGPIGGYNFQAAFSTGWLAGERV